PTVGTWTKITDNDADTITVVSGELFAEANRIKILTVRTVGITAPDAPSEKEKTSGALGEGDYYFKVTYVDEDGNESNGSAASAKMTLGSGEDGLTIYIPILSGNINAVTFVGTGEDDATSGGTFTRDATTSYKVEIDGINGIKTSTLNSGGSGYAVDDTFTVDTG
ncbi:unnamed protein product, partial [marine sediment metagenome]